jgi:hypothetical protein
MGKLISWGLIDQDGKACANCGVPKNTPAGQCQAGKGNCCKDEHRPVKIDKDQKTPEPAHKFLNLPFEIAVGNFAILRDHLVDSYLAGFPTTNAPPGLLKVPVFLRNGNFRI